MYRRNFLYKLLISIFLLFLIPIKAYSTIPDLPNINDKAPNFKLGGYNNNYTSKKEWNLEDWKEKWIVLYFYPKDFTDGCTIEAKGFQKMMGEYKRLNAEVVGISADTTDKHKSFCSSQRLSYTLLSDINAIVSKKYGSWNAPFSSRNTFLISPQGNIAFRWIDVKPLNHAKEVLKKIKELKS